MYVQPYNRHPQRFCGHVRTWAESPKIGAAQHTRSQLRSTQGDTLPSGVRCHAVNRCPLCGLFRAMLSAFFVLFFVGGGDFSV